MAPGDAMSVRIVDHNLAAAHLTVLRDQRTGRQLFQHTLRTLARILAVETTRCGKVRPVSIETPLDSMTGSAAITPVCVPVLRAGLGLLDGFLDIVGDADVAMAGLRRDEETLAPVWYLDTLPGSLQGRDVYVLDPMVATGGSAFAVLKRVKEKQAERVTLMAVLAAPEGIELLSTIEGLDIVVVAVDERLDERGFIRPGLGDAGDRLWGDQPPAVTLLSENPARIDVPDSEQA